MKKLTLALAMTLIATSAFATKSRVTALQAPEHTADSTDVLTKPDYGMSLPEHAVLELSANTTGANDTSPRAEGGFLRKMGENSAMGLYLGSKTNAMTESLDLVSATPTSKNPFYVYYASKMGDLTWGAGLQYSNFENKGTKNKSTTTGLNAGISSKAGWEAQLQLGIAGEATATDTTKYAQKSPMKLRGAYAMDTLTFYGKYNMWGAKTTNIASSATTMDVDKNQINLGVINSHKKDGADFFYGVAYDMTTTKIKDGNKTETTTLPVIMGIEADATSWLVLRGSITQSILLGSTKTTPASGTSTEVVQDDNTKVAAGLGLKLGKFQVDGSLAATSANSGKVGSDTNFITDVGLLYMF